VLEPVDARTDPRTRLNWWYKPKKKQYPKIYWFIDPFVNCNKEKVIAHKDKNKIMKCPLVYEGIFLVTTVS
jgi:hypothetical protein